MALFNADGSRAEMSGNGIRCFAQALAAPVAATSSPQRILTDAGVRHVELLPTEDPATIMASVDMGEVADRPEPEGWAAIGTDPGRPVAHLDLGNPHTVVGRRRRPRRRPARSRPAGAARQPRDRRSRAPRPTPSRCGSTSAGPGSPRPAARAPRPPRGPPPAGGWSAPTSTELVVHMDGGSARVSLHRPEPGRVTLTGPATFVATIEIP